MRTNDSSVSLIRRKHLLGQHTAHCAATFPLWLLYDDLPLRGGAAADRRPADRGRRAGFLRMAAPSLEGLAYHNWEPAAVDTKIEGVDTVTAVAAAIVRRMDTGFDHMVLDCAVTQEPDRSMPVQPRTLYPPEQEYRASDPVVVEAAAVASRRTMLRGAETGGSAVDRAFQAHCTSEVAHCKDDFLCCTAAVVPSWIAVLLPSLVVVVVEAGIHGSAAACRSWMAAAVAAAYSAPWEAAASLYHSHFHLPAARIVGYLVDTLVETANNSTSPADLHSPWTGAEVPGAEVPDGDGCCCARRADPHVVVAAAAGGVAADEDHRLDSPEDARHGAALGNTSDLDHVSDRGCCTIVGCCCCCCYDQNG